MMGNPGSIHPSIIARHLPVDQSLPRPKLTPVCLPPLYPSPDRGLQHRCVQQDMLITNLRQQVGQLSLEKATAEAQLAASQDTRSGAAASLVRPTALSLLTPRRAGNMTAASGSSAGRVAGGKVAGAALLTPRRALASGASSVASEGVGVAPLPLRGPPLAALVRVGGGQWGDGVSGSLQSTSSVSTGAGSVGGSSTASVAGAVQPQRLPLWRPLPGASRWEAPGAYDGSRAMPHVTMSPPRLATPLTGRGGAVLGGLTSTVGRGRAPAASGGTSQAATPARKNLTEDFGGCEEGAGVGAAHV